MKKIFILLSIQTLLLTSCDVMKYELFSSYINNYSSYNSITLSLTESGNILLSRDSSFTTDYSWKSSGNSKAVYDSLCRVHNDLGYNKKKGYIVVPDWGHCAAFDIKSIYVTSASDFDSQHPAGTSLNDVIRFISISLKKYIESGYTFTYDWKNYTPTSFNKEQKMNDYRNDGESQYHCPIDRKLSEISTDEMQFLPSEYFGYLIFDSNPTLDKKHNLTIVVRLSNGKIIRKTIEKTFN